MEEKRRETRHAISFPVSIIKESTEENGLVHNLSAHGCLVESDLTIQEGDYLELNLRLSDEESPLKVETAAVRWEKGRVFGVEFVYMGADEYERLERFIETLKQVPSS